MLDLTQKIFVVYVDQSRGLSSVKELSQCFPSRVECGVYTLMHFCAKSMRFYEISEAKLWQSEQFS